MRAVVCQDANLDVVDLPDPEPGGASCCSTSPVVASAARTSTPATQADVPAEAGYHGFARWREQVVFGHEFCGTDPVVSGGMSPPAAAPALSGEMTAPA